MTLQELLKTIIKKPPVYSTGIEFLDNALDGGFEMGQLVTVTGEPDAGKTMFTEQVLSNVSRGFKCLYLSLEFNRRQAHQRFWQRVNNGTADFDALANVEFVSTEDTDGDMGQVINIINKNIENGTRFIIIDSTLMLHIEGMGGEQEITEIFRRLHALTVKNDVLLFVITQSSKDENKEGRVGIFGSQKASHFANIMLHLTYDKDKDERWLVISKNKQNGEYLKQKVVLSKTLLTFNTYAVEVEEAKKPQQKGGREKKSSLWDKI
ncbi:MAG: AAA family ATPase [Campylobacterales bacterium]|nr:AAA family ATPase [Campylobacterales bacterium]